MNCRLISLLTLVVIVFAITPAAAQTAAVPVDYATVKKEIKVFEGIVDTTIKQLIGGSFPLLSSTQGTFLADYGALFSLEVNLFQIRMISPFSPQPHTQKELDEAYALMVKRLTLAKEAMIKTIGEYGTSIQQLKPEQNLVVAMHLFQVDSQMKQPVPGQVIFKVKRSAIDQYRQNRLPLADFAKQVEIVQF
jgi:hypothetical protein